MEEIRKEETIKGIISEIIFESDASDYKVIEVESENGLELITAVGDMAGIEVGEVLEATGFWKNHPTYGEQFSVRSFIRSMPQTVEAMERYLASGVIKGIGQALARRIVEYFDEETFYVLEHEPERLSEIKGISSAKAVQIAEQFATMAESREVMLYLQQLGLTPSLSMKLYQAYGGKTVQIVQSNPYQLAEQIQGIGFQKADEIAVRVGLSPDSPARLRGAIRYVLLNAAAEGHTYLPEGRLEDEIYELLGFAGTLVEQALIEAELSQLIVRDQKEDSRIYLRSYYLAEQQTALSLLNLAQFGEKLDEASFLRSLAAIEKAQKWDLSKEQKEAIRSAMQEGLLVITGGPGTGKTTIIYALLELLEAAGKKYALAAPTGRAAKRITEATGREAKTIHRLLEFQYGIGDDSARQTFQRNEENPLEADVVIIDEVSMVDIMLAKYLVKAIAPGTRLILLGDADQLPSVGPGNVLKDMLASGKVKTCYLTTIYRQAQESHIIVNAHRINEGEYPIFDNSAGSDFFMMREASADSVMLTLLDVVRTRLPRYLKLSPFDIQVLSPMKKGPLGVQSLNEQLQERLNPRRKDKRELSFGPQIFREGDKVMQIRNNYEIEWRIENKYGYKLEEGKGVFNGDIGRIEKIASDGIEVIFDGNKKTLYDVSLLGQLDLAYAITIHKAQGTQSPAIVLPILNGPEILMTRNLLYTAVTRAERDVVVIGSEKALCRMVDNNQQTRRYTGLKEAMESLALQLEMLV